MRAMPYAGLKTRNLTKNVCAHKRFRHQECLQFWKANCSFNTTVKETTLLAIFSSYKLFLTVWSYLSISKQSLMLIRQYLTMTSKRMALYMIVVLLIMTGSDLSTYTCIASLLRTAFSCTPLMSSTARPT